MERSSKRFPVLLASADPLPLPVRQTRSLRGVLMVLAMSCAVAAVYASPPTPNTILIGSDYLQLHWHRMQFARDALFGAVSYLPAWYPRELLGTPFWSNLQNFPLIPTRLLVVLAMDPIAPNTYGAAVFLSALLSALFTFLFLRRIGLGLLASAAAGWTFACGGFYAARVAAGHLPLLEAYPALPLLLWVIESQLQALSQGESSRQWILTIAGSSACLMLAGHPQLPVYAMAAGAFYALWRGGRHAIRIWSAMILGVGCAAFALVPMGMLVGRSTRLLDLAPPANDIAMPYGRLTAFFLPWRDGVPPLLDADPTVAFHQYPNLAYFWDTNCYIGILPWVALILLIYVFKRSDRVAINMNIVAFLGIIGVAGIILSLPIVRYVPSLVPGTIFRSSSRLLYLTEFVLACGLGIGIHWTFATNKASARILMAVLLALHMVDLGSHSRRFILRGSLLTGSDSEKFANLTTNIADGRTAIDYDLPLGINRTVDDVGFFDSIMLARPYRMLLSLADASPELNIQTFKGSELPAHALASLGVKLVLTKTDRNDLEHDDKILGINVYRIPSSAQRAMFFATDQIRYFSPDQIHNALRDPKYSLSSTLLLPREAAASKLQNRIAVGQNFPQVLYRRPDSDHIECTVVTNQHGFLRIIEAWDPGWSATVNGSPVQIVPALDALMAVPITAGRHEIRFEFRTPGATLGLAISTISLILLFGLVSSSRAKPRKQK